MSRTTAVFKAASTAALVLSATFSAASGVRADDGAADLFKTVFDSEPGKLTYAGITVYGVVDFNFSYMSHGNKPEGKFYPGNQYIISSNLDKSHFAFTNNGMSQSMVGVKGSEDLGKITGASALNGWSAVFDLQMGFDPAFLELADAPGAQVLNNGIAPANQTSNAGGSRAGQILNGEAYGGLKHKDLGEIRYGRQNSILLDVIGQYDPQKLSYANSLIGYSGVYSGGFGITENARWNNALKYKTTIGPVRIAGQYRFGGYGQGEEYYAVALGIDGQGALKALSIDGVWGREKSTITASALTAAQCTAILGSTAGCTDLDVLGATIADTEAYTLMAKYKVSDELTVSGGWEHMTYSNPEHQIASGYEFIGGYRLYQPNNGRYVTDRDLDLLWIGARYSFTPKLVGAAAWYHLDQDAYIARTSTNGANITCTSPGAGRASQSNCAGTLDAISLSFDYQWTKRLDVYTGIMYSTVDDGLSANFLHSSTVTPTLGARYKF